jgi:hypothetical protein
LSDLGRYGDATRDGFRAAGGSSRRGSGTLDPQACKEDVIRRLLSLCTTLALACGGGRPTATGPIDCDPGYPTPDPNVDARIAHNKTDARVVAITSDCTVEVTLGSLGPGNVLSGKQVVLRATSRTTYADTSKPDGPTKLARLGRKPGEAFTLSFDGRPFPDGSYPLNFINR